MQLLRNKTKAATVALFLMSTIAVMLFSFALPVANAHTPAWTIPTWAYIVASPDPIGVGQTAVLVFWIDKMPMTATGTSGDRWRNMNIEITKPDKSKVNLGPLTSDPVGGGYTYYTPDKVGIYTLNFSFPGQVLTIPGVGQFATGNAYLNDTFLASWATTTLTVQQEPVAGPPSYPLPTEYWTRPIEGQNAAWATIASHWLGGSTSDHYNVQPNGIAPNRPHIMWTKPLEDGGIVGNTYPIESMTYYAGGTYEGRFRNAMIIHGRLYYELPRGSSGGGGGYVCVDLLTGETLWWKNYTTTPSLGQLFYYSTMNQQGVLPNGYLWQVVGTTWNAYDSLTGNWLFTLTNVPSGTNVYGANGEITRYVINYPQRWLALWNNTQDFVGLNAGTTPGTWEGYQWRPVGKTVDMRKAYSWNVTIPNLPSVGGSPTIQKVIPGDMLLGSFGSPGAIGGSGSLTSLANPGCTVFAISLEQNSRGHLLWIQNYTAPPNYILRSFGPVDIQSRVFTFVDEQTMQWWGYSMDNGRLLWGPAGESSQRVFSYYSSQRASWVVAAHSVAYGKLYVAGQGGILYAYDIKTGKLLWTYGNGGPGNSTRAPLGDPWGFWPLYISNIADGKIYTYTYEHSTSAPIRKDQRIRCIDATTGKELWTLLGWPASPSHASMAGVIADGYFAYDNFYDSQVYCIGKGPSATTVSASPNVITNGSSTLIQGTVIDTAAGTKQKEQAARFPNGVPAVSDASMSTWMEYVYMQKPCPTNATGVTVFLQAMRSDGSIIDITHVTSDIMGHYEYMWTPPTTDTYKILATFEGSESYWTSYDATGLSVGPAPPAEPEPVEIPAEPDYTPMFAAMTAIIVAAIAVVGIAILITLRKRK